MAYVYRHIRLDNNVPFYIGVGSDNKGYYERSINTSRRSRYWYEIVSKTQYRVEILIDDIDLIFAFEKEKEFISLYGREDLGTGTLCNKQNGGLGNSGYIPNEEALSNMRAAQSKKKWPSEKRKLIGSWRKNLTQDKWEELKEKQNAGRHKIFFNVSSKIDGNNFGEFTLTEAAKYFKIGRSSIFRYLTTVREHPIYKFTEARRT